MKHHIWMLLACLVPLSLIFFLPASGMSSSGLFVLLIFGCFAMHLFMMRSSGHTSGTGDKDDEHRH